MATKKDTDKAAQSEAELRAQARVDKAAYINAQLVERLAPHDHGLRPAPDARPDGVYPVADAPVKGDV